MKYIAFSADVLLAYRLRKGAVHADELRRLTEALNKRGGDVDIGKSAGLWLKYVGGGRFP